MSAEATADIKFTDLGLPETLLQALRTVGYESPSPIQAATIPPLLAGRDMIGQAQTGTGKTAAFALPALARLEPAVLPVPVWAWPSTSRPASSGGMVAAWIGLGVS